MDVQGTAARTPRQEDYDMDVGSAGERNPRRFAVRQILPQKDLQFVYGVFLLLLVLITMSWKEGSALSSSAQLYTRPCTLPILRETVQFCGNCSCTRENRDCPRASAGWTVPVFAVARRTVPARLN